MFGLRALTETERAFIVPSMARGAVLVVGGTSGIGLGIAEAYAARGRDVVITGRTGDRCAEVAQGISRTGQVSWRALDLAEPQAIAGALEDLGEIAHVVLAAIERDQNTVAEYDIARAVRLVTLKLVGYTEVVHALIPGLSPEASILLFGGLALRRPYPGSTTITTVNGGVEGLVRTLAVQLAPVRVNAIHPGIVGDTPEWADKPATLDAVRARTPAGRLVTTEDVVGAAVFLLENRGVNGVTLEVDGGWMLQ
jgi:NAD(P)-dependent dehydrogenase (short-subunit alcohol dehydrogenase family)